MFKVFGFLIYFVIFSGQACEENHLVLTKPIERSLVQSPLSTCPIKSKDTSKFSKISDLEFKKSSSDNKHKSSKDLKKKGEKVSVNVIGGASLSNLTYVYLENIDLDHRISSLATLKALECLILTHNRLKKFPKELNCLTQLKILKVNYNLLTALPLEDTTQFPHLKILDCSFNRLNCFFNQWENFLEGRKMPFIFAVYGNHVVPEDLLNPFFSQNVIDSLESLKQTQQIFQEQQESQNRISKECKSIILDRIPTKQNQFVFSSPEVIKEYERILKWDIKGYQARLQPR